MIERRVMVSIRIPVDRAFEWVGYRAFEQWGRLDRAHPGGHFHCQQPPAPQIRLLRSSLSLLSHGILNSRN